MGEGFCEPCIWSALVSRIYNFSNSNSSTRDINNPKAGTQSRHFAKGDVHMASMLNICGHQGNVNQNHTDITSYPLEWLVTKTDDNKFWRGCRRIGALTCCWWNRKWSPAVENHLPIPQVVNRRVAIPSGNMYPRERKNTCAWSLYTSVHHSAFIIAQEQEQPKCPLSGLTKRGVSVQWDILGQLNGVLLPATTQMDLGNIGRSSHRGAINLASLCQSGCLPSSQVHPEAASHQWPAGSVLLQGPWLKRPGSGSEPSTPHLVPLSVLRCGHLCLPLLAASAPFWPVRPSFGMGLIHSSSLRSITWRSVVAALFFLFISPSHIIDGSAGWRVSGWKSFSLCSFEDCFVPFYLPKLLLRNPKPCWFGVLCAPFPPLSESLPCLACHAMSGVGLHSSLLLAQCILPCGNVTSCPGGVLSYFFPCVFPVLSFCYLIFESLEWPHIFSPFFSTFHFFVLWFQSLGDSLNLIFQPFYWLFFCLSHHIFNFQELFLLSD